MTFFQARKRRNPINSYRNKYILAETYSFSEGNMEPKFLAVRPKKFGREVSAGLLWRDVQINANSKFLQFNRTKVCFVANRSTNNTQNNISHLQKLKIKQEVDTG